MSMKHLPNAPSSLGQSKSSSRAQRSGMFLYSSISSFLSPMMGAFFRAHKEVLWFASPFFQAALSGHWAETGRPLSMSSVITISQPPSVPGDKVLPDAPTAMTFAAMDPDLDPDELDIDTSESSEPEVIESPTPTIVVAGKDDKQTHGVESDAGSEASAQNKKVRDAARMESLEKLQKGAESSAHSDREKGNGAVKLSWKRGNVGASTRHQLMTSKPDAVIVLKEEKV